MNNEVHTMSQEFVIEAFPRDDQGRGASRRLRREERKIPAIIYGGGKDATPVAIWHNELKKALENEAFFSHILTIDIQGKKESVILKDLQRHPRSEEHTSELQSRPHLVCRLL